MREVERSIDRHRTTSLIAQSAIRARARARGRTNGLTRGDPVKVKRKMIWLSREGVLSRVPDTFFRVISSYWRRPCAPFELQSSGWRKSLSFRLVRIMNRDPNRISLTELPLARIRIQRIILYRCFPTSSFFRFVTACVTRASSLPIVSKIRAAFVTRCFERLERQL